MWRCEMGRILERTSHREPFVPVSTDSPVLIVPTMAGNDVCLTRLLSHSFSPSQTRDKL